MTLVIVAFMDLVSCMLYAAYPWCASSGLESSRRPASVERKASGFIFILGYLPFLSKSKLTVESHCFDKMYSHEKKLNLGRSPQPFSYRVCLEDGCADRQVSPKIYCTAPPFGASGVSVKQLVEEGRI